MPTTGFCAVWTVLEEICAWARLRTSHTAHDFVRPWLLLLRTRISLVRLGAAGAACPNFAALLSKNPRMKMNDSDSRWSWFEGSPVELKAVSLSRHSNTQWKPPHMLRQWLSRGLWGLSPSFAVQRSPPTEWWIWLSARREVSLHLLLGSPSK